jgi:hypothetical protein
VSRKRSKKPRPKPSPTVITVDKAAAAKGQLESAIFLWFNEAAPISILVLASNAHDCYHALGKKIGKPSFWQEFVETVAPRSFRERTKYVQDFAKHGFKDLEESTPFSTRKAEALMFISVAYHQEIAGQMTALMGLYWARALSENPTWANRRALPDSLVDSGIIDEVGQGSRKQCFNRFQVLFEEALRGLHL